MKIHYFYNHEQGGFGFYKLELRAYLEEKEYSRLGELRLNFRCLEHLNIHISKNQKAFQSNDFTHRYGAENCLCHFSHSVRELNEDMKSWGLYPIDRRNYERFRKVGIKLYQNTDLVDFSNFTGPQKSIGRVIIGD